MTRCSSPVPWIAPNSDGQVYSAWPSCTSNVRVSIKLQKLVKVVVLPVRFPKDCNQVFIACAVDCAELWRPGWKANIWVISHRRMIVSTVHIRHLSRFDPQGRQAAGKRDKTRFCVPPRRCITVSPMHDPSPPPSATHCDADWLGGLVASSTTRVGNLAFSDPQLESSRSSNAIQGRGLPPPLSTLYVSKLRRLRHTRVDPHLRLKEQYHSRAAVLRSRFPPRPGPLFWAHMGAGAPRGHISHSRWSLAFTPVSLPDFLYALETQQTRPSTCTATISPFGDLSCHRNSLRSRNGTRRALALPGYSRWKGGASTPGGSRRVSAFHVAEHFFIPKKTAR
ncbi:hypothetical protein B0H14DRAFT_2641277 [Mycena olivaceomarginata]|nr:hypothetical protein B0H14DRAFT_2641277 [Mycena olivaceomarginata]